ncbi:MAG: hypothetical protein II938_04945 [Alphaproteobacteria bacterium]|nr:hypothetical protein [Alphaproteobacteria bacterium]
MTDTIKDTKTMDLALELEDRYSKANFYVLSTALYFPMKKRRQIAAHIKEGAKIAQNDIGYGMLAIKRDLMHDFWGEINKRPSARKERIAKISDFAVMVATLPPANRSKLKEILDRIAPSNPSPTPLPTPTSTR